MYQGYKEENNVSYFDFKQFRVYHDHCAMKVGTDGVLLGAWADVSHVQRILDIGCGSGLIALMAAQRSEAQVIGIEIDAAAAAQAKENCMKSPFSKRITIIEEDLQNFRIEQKFDCILTNPPYFEETLLPPEQRRATARHTVGLDFSALVQETLRLMSPNALFQLILPYKAVGHFLTVISFTNLSLLRRTDIVTRQGKMPKRTLLCFKNNVSSNVAPIQDTLELTAGDGTRSEAYARLTRDFYLDKPARNTNNRQ